MSRGPVRKPHRLAARPRRRQRPRQSSHVINTGVMTATASSLLMTETHDMTSAPPLAVFQATGGAQPMTSGEWIQNGPVAAVTDNVLVYRRTFTSRPLLAAAAGGSNCMLPPHPNPVHPQHSCKYLQLPRLVARPEVLKTARL